MGSCHCCDTDFEDVNVSLKVYVLLFVKQGLGQLPTGSLKMCLIQNLHEA